MDKKAYSLQRVFYGPTCWEPRFLHTVYVRRLACVFLELKRDWNEPEHCLKSVFRTAFHQCSACVLEFWELTATWGALQAGSCGGTEFWHRWLSGICFWLIFFLFFNIKCLHLLAPCVPKVQIPELLPAFLQQINGITSVAHVVACYWARKSPHGLNTDVSMYPFRTKMKSLPSFLSF